MNKTSEILSGVFYGLALVAIVLAILCISEILPTFVAYIAIGIAVAGCACKIVSSALKDTDY